MKNFLKPLVLIACSSALALAQEPPHKPSPDPQQKTTNPTVTFLGKTFTLQSATTSKFATTNDYYLPKQKRTSFSHRLTIHYYPGKSGAAKAAKSSIDFFNKRGNPSELEAAPPKGVVGVYRTLKMKGGLQYNISAYIDAPDGKSMSVKVLALRISNKNKEAALKMLKSDRLNLLQKLAAVKFPKLVSDMKAPPSKLALITELPMVLEKVTNIQTKGRRWIIDDQFAKKNGAKPTGHRPFSLRIITPESGKILYLTRPKIADIIRFTLATDDQKVRESIRFTSLSISKDIPMEKRLIQTAQFLEQALAAKFFAAYQGGKIVKRYQTNIGPYRGAVLLGQLKLKNGSIFYIKLVSILSQDHDKGLAAVMLLNPKHYDPKMLSKHLSDGYAQRVLHSVRFLKKKSTP